MHDWGNVYDIQDSQPYWVRRNPEREQQTQIVLKELNLKEQEMNIERRKIVLVPRPTLLYPDQLYFTVWVREQRKIEIQGALEKTKIEGGIDIQKRKVELEGKT